MTKEAPLQLKIHMASIKGGALCGAKVADAGRIVHGRDDVVNCKRCLDKIELEHQMERLRDEHLDHLNLQQYDRAANAVFGFVYMFRRSNSYWPTIQRVGKALGLSFDRVQEIALSQTGLSLVEKPGEAFLPLSEREVGVEWLIRS